MASLAESWLLDVLVELRYEVFKIYFSDLTYFKVC